MCKSLQGALLQGRDGGDTVGGGGPQLARSTRQRFFARQSAGSCWRTEYDRLIIVCVREVSHPLTRSGQAFGRGEGGGVKEAGVEREQCPIFHKVHKVCEIPTSAPMYY